MFSAGAKTVGSVLKIKIVRRQNKRCKLPVGVQGSDKVKSEVRCGLKTIFKNKDIYR